MYKLCKTEQSAARQRQLEQGLLQAMLVRRYEEISVSELCDQLELPRKSFYRYFSGKDGALHALIDHTLLEYEQFPQQEKAGEEPPRQGELERFFLFWRSRKNLLDALARSDLIAVLVVRAIEMAKASLGLSERNPPRELHMTRDHAVMFGVCGLMNMMLQWHRDGFDMPPRELAAIALRLLSQPLVASME